MKNYLSKNKGFTLIELLVVIAIIGILSTLIMSNMNAARLRARDAQRKSDLRQIGTSIRMYYNDHASSYPPTADLVFGSELKVGSMVYMKRVPHDPSWEEAEDTDYDYSYDPATDPDDFCLIAVLENGSDGDIAKSQTRCSACGPFDITDYVICAD